MPTTHSARLCPISKNFARGDTEHNGSSSGLLRRTRDEKLELAELMTGEHHEEFQKTNRPFAGPALVPPGWPPGGSAQRYLSEG
jgi:hypothetical protein